MKLIPQAHSPKRLMCVMKFQITVQLTAHSSVEHIDIRPFVLQGLRDAPAAYISEGSRPQLSSVCKGNIDSPTKQSSLTACPPVWCGRQTDKLSYMPSQRLHFLPH